ncbi:MAG: hypothetical protein ACOCX2_14965 [Armatimonadota bacterium]
MHPARLTRPSAHFAGVLLATLAVTALTTGCARAQLCPELSQVASELDRIDAEIALIQDMNTLQLTEEQLRFLVPAVDSLRSTAILQEEDRVELLQQLKPLLEQERALALRDQPPSDELADEIAEINGRLVAADEAQNEALLPHAETFREILTDPQTAIITGEEDARRQALDLIDWVRQLDDAAFEEQVPALATELADPELGLGQDEIVDLLSVVRAMTPEQYERAGEDVVGQLTELYRPSVEDADQVIVQVFLHEAMPTVLEDMLAVITGE